MFMFHRQMGGQVDSERERAGDSWERGSVVASLHMHSCAGMFIIFFMRANGWAGEQQKGGCACDWSWLLMAPLIMEDDAGAEEEQD